MPYNTDLPPTIARTGQSTYELRDATGAVIATYNQAPFDSPDDWWSDLIQYVLGAVQGGSKTENAVNDISLLSIKEDWNYVDER